jgi:hypothetical protein
MTEADSSNTLIVKRLRVLLKGPDKAIRRNLFFLFLIVTEIAAIGFIVHPFTEDWQFHLMVWTWALNMPLFIWLLRGLRSDQGDLTLTPEGFEIQNVDPFYRRKYRWTEVTGFYQESKPRHHYVVEPMVCFDEASCATKKRKKIIPFSYEIGSKALVDLLNEWKEKYGPNPDGFFFEPILEPPKTLLDRRKQIVILIAFGMPCAALLILGWLGIGLLELNETSVRVVNETGEFVKGFFVVPIPLIRKKHCRIILSL